jgi:adenine-specific DNA-methyltransferase
MTNSLGDRPNLMYPIKYQGEDIFPDKQWVWSKDRLELAILNNEVVFNNEKGKWSVRSKQYLKDEKGVIRRGKPISILNGPFTQEGTEDLRSIFGKEPFGFPKPVNLVKFLLSFRFNDEFNMNATILDFFAGSGTTLHATMALNAEDGGRRQCILVTNNENNICEEVTYERNKRVIEGYTNAKGVWVEGLSGNNLRYYKTATVEREPSLRNKRQLTRLATELLCIKEDCYQLSEQDLMIGQDGQDFDSNQLNNLVGRVNPKNHVQDNNRFQDNTMVLFEDNGKRLLLVYDDIAIDEAVELLKQLIAQNDSFITKVYVFSNGQYPYTEDFEEVLPHITLCALPDAIYKAYQHVLPKREAPVRVELEEENSLEED